MVRYAGISSDLNHFHGRTGMGAVMGSKNLKAVSVRGTKKPEFADPEKIKELGKFFAQNYKENADNSSQAVYGTSQYYFNANKGGLLPSYNFTTGYFEGAEKMGLEEMHRALKVRTEGCYACPVRCKQVFQSEKPYKIDPRYGAPEFETLGAFNSVCGVNDLFAAAKAHEMCNRYGLDTISTGVTIAFAIECFENGLITKDDTGGIELRYGDAEVMLDLVEKIANRDGFGDILAEGSKIAAEKIGKGAIKYSMQTKGQEFPMAEPRAKFGIGLAYAVSPTGADHIQHEHDGAFDPNLTGYSHKSDEPSIFVKHIYPLGLLDPVKSLYLGPEKVRLFTYFQSLWSMFECLDICVFTFAPVRTFLISQLADMVQAVTGWDTSLWELMKAGERATTMARVFNLTCGLTKEEDSLPDRIFEELGGTALKGVKFDRQEFSHAIDLYYEMMGWTREAGIPAEGRLHELNLGWLAKKLYK